jgi:hypothetical protein
MVTELTAIAGFLFQNDGVSCKSGIFWRLINEQPDERMLETVEKKEL